MKAKIKTVWGEIRDRLPEEERYEMKSLIGFDLVEQTEEILRETNQIESFSSLVLLSSDSKTSAVEHIKHFTEFTDSVNAEIEGFIDCFRMKPSSAEMSSFLKGRPNITSPQEIGVANDFRGHLMSLDKIRHLIGVELQNMRIKLGNLQTVVLSILTGGAQTKIITDGEKPNTISKLTWMDEEENEGDLESSLDAARMMYSRFNHRCERCIPRGHVGGKFSPATHSSTHDQIRKELISPSLDSLSDNESDSGLLIPGDLSAKEMGEFSTVGHGGGEGTQLSSLQIPSPVPLQTSSRMTNVPGALQTLMLTTAARSFNRIPPLSKLHPLKLRPVAKANGRLSRFKGVGHSAVNSRKSPLPALSGDRAPDLKSSGTSANASSYMPRKSSVSRPPPSQPSSTKGVLLPVARKMV